MTFRPSTPSKVRRKRAALLFLLFAVIGSLIRLSRRDFDLLPILAPLDFQGTSTNFFVCAGAPFVAFFLEDVSSLASYAKTAFGTAAGLSIYEVVQIYMPSRTFDPYDILASFLGAIFTVIIANVLVLRQRQKGKTIEHGAPPNVGPAERLGSSGVGGGPPSVS